MELLRVCLETFLENSLLFFRSNNSFLTQKTCSPNFGQKKGFLRMYSEKQVFLEQI